MSVFGQEAEVSLAKSVQTGLSVSGSVTNSISKTLTYELKKSEDAKGYYVNECYTKGNAIYVQFITINCISGTQTRNVKNTIAYMPRTDYKPVTQFNYFKNDPQDTKRYTKVHS